MWVNQIRVLMNLQLLLKRRMVSLVLSCILNSLMISGTLSLGWDSWPKRNFEPYLERYVFSECCNAWAISDGWHEQLFLALCECGRDWGQWSTNTGEVGLAFTILHPGAITTQRTAKLVYPQPKSSRHSRLRSQNSGSSKSKIPVQNRLIKLQSPNYSSHFHQQWSTDSSSEIIP